MALRAKTTPMNRGPANLAGLTLLETVIAIVIGLVILAGVGTLVYRAVSTNKVSESYKQIATIIQNVRNLYSGSQPSTTPSVTISTYINAGVFPQASVSGSSAYNPYGGAYTFRNTSGVSSTVQLWLLSYGVPQAACIKLFQKTAALKLVTYAVGGAGSGASAPDLAWAESSCSSTSNTMEFRFDIR